MRSRASTSRRPGRRRRRIDPRSSLPAARAPLRAPVVVALTLELVPDAHDEEDVFAARHELAPRASSTGRRRRGGGGGWGVGGVGGVGGVVGGVVARRGALLVAVHELDLRERQAAGRRRRRRRRRRRGEVAVFLHVVAAALLLSRPPRLIIFLPPCERPARGQERRAQREQHGDAARVEPVRARPPRARGRHRAQPQEHDAADLKRAAQRRHRRGGRLAKQRGHRLHAQLAPAADAEEQHPEEQTPEAAAGGERDEEDADEAQEEDAARGNARAESIAREAAEEAAPVHAPGSREEHRAELFLGEAALADEIPSQRGPAVHCDGRTDEEEEEEEEEEERGEMTEGRGRSAAKIK
eukprot:31555-Pelagococcus_subviridis.AAC.27